MTTVDQVCGLISSHLDRDDERFMTIVRQIEAGASRNGHRSIQERIQSILSRGRRMTPQLRVMAGGLVAELEPTVHFDRMVLSDKTRGAIQRVIDENKARDKLHDHKLWPRRKILMVGPPGTGKTITASALASGLGMPLFHVQQSGLIESYMGHTSENLAKVFEHIRQDVGVYLFDEFDALGTERDWSGPGSGPADGEMRRTLNSLLVMLERDDSQSLILASTNHASILDRALFRRFDDIIRFGLPTSCQAFELVQKVFEGIGFHLEGEIVANAVGSLSHSEIESACLESAKRVLLSHEGPTTGEMAVPADVLVSELRSRTESTLGRE